MNSRFAATLLAISTLLFSIVARTEDVALWVAAFPDNDQMIKESLRAWKKDHSDVTIRIISRELDAHQLAMKSVLDGKSPAAMMPSVIVLDSEQSHELLNSGKLEDLSKPPYDAVKFKEKFADTTWASAVASDHTLVVLPANMGVSLYFAIPKSAPHKDQAWSFIKFMVFERERAK
jgi:multiple sugar transport system substrate-binding protein